MQVLTYRIIFTKTHMCQKRLNMPEQAVTFWTYLLNLVLSLYKRYFGRWHRHSSKKMHCINLVMGWRETNENIIPYRPSMRCTAVHSIHAFHAEFSLHVTNRVQNAAQAKRFLAKSPDISNLTGQKSNKNNKLQQKLEENKALAIKSAWFQN